MEAVAANAALPGVKRERQQLLNLRHGVVEGCVKAGHLGQVRLLAQQDVYGLQRKGLMQGRQGD